MPAITLVPVAIPPNAIVRSMTRSLAVGLVAIPAFLAGGWLAIAALPLALYALAGLFWYPWTEWRIRRERIVFGREAIQWTDGRSTAYRNIQALRYRGNGHRLQLLARDGDWLIALHHYSLSGATDEHDLLKTLVDRVRRENAEALIDVRG